MDGKQRYYAALERQQAAEASLSSHLSRDGANGSGPRSSENLDALYIEMGVRALGAFNNFLDFCSELGRRGGARTDGGSAFDARAVGRAVEDSLGERIAEISRQLQELTNRLSRCETSLAAVEAGLKRIDKFTLEAFRSTGQLDRQIGELAGRIERVEAAARQSPESVNRRLPREKARELALAAAGRLAAQGERLTLAAVAREAGLKYGQIMYAFGNKEAFFAELAQARPAPAAEADDAAEPGGAAPGAAPPGSAPAGAEMERIEQAV
ncbi:MAG TPA: hypothetical protein VF234_00035 [Limnochordia bacterium]